MQVRLPSTPPQDLRRAPLDGLDAFVMSRIFGTMDVAELVELVPCDADEVARRLVRLCDLGLVELLEIAAVTPSTRARSLDESATLRPPAPPPAPDRAGETRRPPKRTSVALEAQFPASDTGVRLRRSRLPPAWSDADCLGALSQAE